MAAIPAGSGLRSKSKRRSDSMRRNLIQMLAWGVVFIGMITSGAGLSQAQSGGEALFKETCTVCHGPDGKAETPRAKKLGAADLTSTEVQSQSDVKLTEVITIGKNKMPSYDGRLSKDEIAELVAYIRDLGKKH
jgi:mono/diheme cytochrome c family protein